MGAYVPTGGGGSSAVQVTPADNLANPANITADAAFQLVWDAAGVQWVRAKAVVPNDALAGGGVALQNIAGFGYFWDEASNQWFKVRGRPLGNVTATGQPGTTRPEIIGWNLLSNPGGNTTIMKQPGAGGDVSGVLAALAPGATPTAATAGANTAVTTTYGATAGQQHRLVLLMVSFSGAAPAAGTTLIVQDGAATVFSIDVPAALASPFPVPLPGGGIIGTVNTAMTITLAAGGAGAIGKLNTAKYTG